MSEIAHVSLSQVPNFLKKIISCTIFNRIFKVYNYISQISEKSHLRLFAGRKTHQNASASNPANNFIFKLLNLCTV